jgi:hypothetical protein
MDKQVKLRHSSDFGRVLKKERLRKLNSNPAEVFLVVVYQVKGDLPVASSSRRDDRD